MAHWIFKADVGADVAVRWITLLTIVGGALSWLTKNAGWFGDLTWPQAILLGIAFALGISLLAALALAVGAFAFRLIRPPPMESDKPTPEMRLANRIQTITACRGLVIGFRDKTGYFSDYAERGASFMAIRRHLDSAFHDEFETERHTPADESEGGQLPPLAKRFLAEVDKVAERWGIE